MGRQQGEAGLENSETCSLKIKHEGYQSHKSFIIAPLCGIWQHGLCLSATDYTHVIYQITKACYWGIGPVTFTTVSTYTFHLSWSCSRNTVDQKHAVAANIFIHAGNNFLITGEVKQSTYCHYILTRMSVCNGFQKKLQPHHKISILSNRGNKIWALKSTKLEMWQCVPSGRNLGNYSRKHSAIYCTVHISLG